LDANEGVDGTDVLVLDIPENVLAEYEWVEEESRNYRECLVPAAILNAYEVDRLTEDD
jgi:hypothetical protein